MPWEDRLGQLAAIALALLLTIPPGAASLAPTPTASPTDRTDEPEADLAQPLLKLAQTPEEAEAVRHGHAAGLAWATATLADPPTPGEAIAHLYTALGIATPVRAEPVPGAFAAPLATLVTLQAHHAAQTGPYATLDQDAAQAFTLGALEPTLDQLEDARHHAPEEPILVDPLGLVVLGGSGDNSYEPQPVGPTEWRGAHLVVEPAGNDTYNVPVASPTSISSATAPGIYFQVHTLALELGGNDTYNDRTASADLGATTQAILLDERGNDTYADTDIKRTTAHASPGFAYLKDEQGNDTYHGHGEYVPDAERSGSIAHAVRGGTATLWDEQGNDRYIANPDARFTHAMAHSREAEALLWDENGNDTYEADVWAYGSSWNDALARFLDDQGDDAYAVFIPNSSFGFHNEQLAAFLGDGTLDRGLGEFVDARGSDVYIWDQLGSGKDHAPQNEDDHVDHREDRKWGVFIDCTTPHDADLPCPEQQHEARCTILRHPAEHRSSTVEELLRPVQERVDDRCRSAGP